MKSTSLFHLSFVAILLCSSFAFSEERPLDLNEFTADPDWGVRFRPDGSWASMSTDTVVRLFNDEIRTTIFDLSIQFDYVFWPFLDPMGYPGRLDAYLYDPSTGDRYYSFHTDDTLCDNPVPGLVELRGTVVWDISGAVFLGQPVGLQFVLCGGELSDSDPGLDPMQPIIITPMIVDAEISNVLIISGPANSPPSPEAGENIPIPSADQPSTVIPGTVTDPDGDCLEYRWLEGEDVLVGWSRVGPNGEAYLDLRSLPYLSAGTHTLTLEVRECGQGGFLSSDTMILTIENSPPEAQPAPGHQVVEIGIDPIVVVADVSDFDGDVASYQWLKEGEVLESGEVETIQGGEAVTIPELNIPAGDPRFPLGLHQIDLTVDDGTNEPVTASVTLEVKDTTGPNLSPIPSVTILWPPNHELVPVTIVANACDNGGGAISLSVDVRSSDTPDQDGDGNTIPDYEIVSIDHVTGVIELLLRSERSGKGDGRTYTIIIAAVDTSGNESTAMLEILAPHDRGKRR